MIIDDDIADLALSIGGTDNFLQLAEFFEVELVEVLKSFVAVKTVIGKTFADGAFNPSRIEFAEEIIGAIIHAGTFHCDYGAKV